MYLFDPDDSRPIHFMGIGGAGMSALALIAERRGVAVTGCDSDGAGASSRDLTSVGFHVGHDSSHIDGVRAVVFTAAIKPDHPELEAARESGVPVFRRAEALQSLVERGSVVGISGTHGKTTTTAMATDILAKAGLDPTGIGGGRVDEWQGNARAGGMKLYVVEADEYDQSFLLLRPKIAVVNSVEGDHMECYGTMERLEAAFVEFANCADRVIVGGDDPGAMRVARQLSTKVWTVGVGTACDFQISVLERTSERSVAVLDSPVAAAQRFELTVPGLHNIRNAASAMAVAAAMDVDLEQASASLAAFKGVGRRFEIVGEYDGVTVVDDYAHHSTEVIATLGAARQRFPESRLIAVFQPHLYSRTESLASALGLALSTADVVIVSDIYAAREKPIPGVSGKMVADAVVDAGGVCHWIPELSSVSDFLGGFVKQGDCVITLGAGDITNVGRALHETRSGATV